MLLPTPNSRLPTPISRLPTPNSLLSPLSSLSTFIGHPIGQVKSLAWFGFGADPPTLSHRAIVDAVLGTGKVEKVVVFPAGEVPYKDFQAGPVDRVAMCELWKEEAEFAAEVIISRFDILSDQAIIWFELWKTITQFRPSIEHYLIVGMDEYLDIPDIWAEGRELFNLANLMIIPREGYDDDLEYLQKNEDFPTPTENHFFLDIPELPGSSTRARKGDLSLVDDKVRKYMMEQGLYKPQQNS